MIQNLKKQIAALVVATTLTATFTPKAEAGIILLGAGVGTGAILWNSDNVTDGDLGWFLLCEVSGITGVALIIAGAITGNVSLMVLDQNGTQTSTASKFAETFPFLADQPSILSALSQEFEAQAKIAASNAASTDQTITVRMSEDKVRSILEAAVLTEAQANQVVKQLK